MKVLKCLSNGFSCLSVALLTVGLLAVPQEAQAGVVCAGFNCPAGNFGWPLCAIAPNVCFQFIITCVCGNDNQKLTCYCF